MHRNFVILQKKTTPSDRKQNSTPSDCEQNSTLSDKDQHLVGVTFPEDVGLPYMTDGRHPPDTLFLVAEHDFRFYREHCVSTKDWLSEVDDFVSEYLEGPDMGDSWGILQPADAPDTDPAPPSPDQEAGGGTTAVEPDAHRDKSEVQREGFSSWGFSEGRKFVGEEAFLSEELNDLVRIATFAHRRGKGDLIWYSWVGGKPRNSVPSHGSTLLGVSKEGAFKLLSAIRKQETVGHFDLWLRDACTFQREGLQASYVLPSVGSYDEHIPGYDPTSTGEEGGWRPSNWDEYWCQEGVRVQRRDAWHKHRNICEFRPQEATRDWGIPVLFDEKEVHGFWKTEQHPRAYWQGDHVWEHILRRRGWLDKSGWLKIPFFLQAPRNNHSWRQLQSEPDAHPWDSERGMASPISHIAEFVVTFHHDDLVLLRSHLAKEHETMRDHLMRYKRRFFVEDKEKAG